MKPCEWWRNDTRSRSGEGVGGDNTGDESPDRTAHQLANLRRLGQKLDAMPTAAVADGLSNRDHDRMLYGK